MDFGFGAATSLGGLIINYLNYNLIYYSVIKLTTIIIITGEPLRIQISDNVKTSLQSFQGFSTEERGSTSVKGKGVLDTHWLTGFQGDGTDQRGEGMTQRRQSRGLYDQYQTTPQMR